MKIQCLCFHEVARSHKRTIGYEVSIVWIFVSHFLSAVQARDRKNLHCLICTHLLNIKHIRTVLSWKIPCIVLHLNGNSFSPCCLEWFVDYFQTLLLKISTIIKQQVICSVSLPTSLHFDAPDVFHAVFFIKPIDPSIFLTFQVVLCSLFFP